MPATIEDAFLAIVFQDDELLRAEFDALVAASWDPPPPPLPALPGPADRPSRWPPAPSPVPLPPARRPREAPRLRRQRSPPSSTGDGR